MGRACGSFAIVVVESPSSAAFDRSSGRGALWKTAVVLPRIYCRYHHGLTKDDRFAPLILPVKVLCHQAAKAFETGWV